MSYRQHGAEPKGAGLSRIFFLVAWVLPLLQTTSGNAQDPQPSPDTESAAATAEPTTAEPTPAPEATTLAFEQTRFAEVRAGHVTLSWVPLAENGTDREIEYRVRDESGAVLYRGDFPRAFISGLPDGTHRFELDAFDGDGDLVASAAEPALVEVSHWPMRYAWASFGAGLVVVTTLLFVIIGGALKSRRERLARVAAEGRPGGGDSAGVIGRGAS